MLSQIQHRVQQLADAEASPAGGLVGLEKEGLRVSRQGHISQTQHPRSLGAALTHPYITTDYSEALLELITPPHANPHQTIGFLHDAHAHVHQHLTDEILWAASMPCIIDTPEDIPIARYGTSNAGRMKSIYRIGLGHRYGRMMQIISGVHFNYSLPEKFWPAFQQLTGSKQDLQPFIDEQYFGLMRNLQRLGWVIPYLFGASPAICNSFLANRDTHLQPFSCGTHHEPWATSLRMGDIGYTNRQEEGVGIKACYDNLECYIKSLRCAISTPCKSWQNIGVQDPDGTFRQLNANILQIENEYYSTIRPKQIQHHLEKPIHALGSRGVKYIELRSLDIDPFDPLGISEETMRFLETFMVLCLLADSPLISEKERKFIDRNIEDTAHLGRAAEFELAREQGPVLLTSWLNEILEAMEGVCELLDTNSTKKEYLAALNRIRSSGARADETPSARILREMREQQVGYFEYTLKLSEQHRKYFLEHPLPASRKEFFDQEAAASLLAQSRMEQSENIPFEEFLKNYFST